MHQEHLLAQHSGTSCSIFLPGSGIVSHVLSSLHQQVVLAPGKPQYTSLSSRPGLSSAASMRSGRLVAPTTATPFRPSTPSSSVSSWFTTLECMISRLCWCNRHVGRVWLMGMHVWCRNDALAHHAARALSPAPPLLCLVCNMLATQTICHANRRMVRCARCHAKLASG